jgi:phosphoglucosamine mutase
MSNDGLVRAVEAAGGRVLRAPVGDRHIVEAMERSGAMLGGEQSGHVIFRDLASTGDGLLTAIQLVGALRAAGGPSLGELAARIPRLPQVVINSAVRHKDQWQVDPLFADAVARATARLGSRGRIIVRSSGTEPKLRIMVEGEEPEEIATIARELAELATARLN